MKRSVKNIITIAVSLVATLSASAQYYQIANQIPQLLQPALSGSGAYKGFVEASYVKGCGTYQADFLSFSTTQGYSYSSWFFMGVGAGVDVMFSHVSDTWGNWQNPSYDKTNYRTSAAMIPLYTDFRVNVGGQQNFSLFIDLRLGCSFLIGSNYVSIHNGYLTNQEYFYLRPSLGMRFPLNKQGKQAANVGFTYQLLTSNYWYNSGSNITLNAIGMNLSYEW